MTERRSGHDRRKAYMPPVARLMAFAFGVVLVIALALSITSVLLAKRVDKNAQTLASLTDNLRRVEAHDAAILRRASYRICEREQRDRAEQHFRAQLSPPAAIHALAKQLGLPDTVVELVSLAAVQKRLPIFDCTPNLSGGTSIPLSPRKQAEYVKRYARGELDPTP
jgi:hypothetical protein